MLNERFQKALILSAFFVAALLLVAISPLNACELNRYDQVVVVKRVTDGDTLILKDGRKVRLIGINTPELATKNRIAEPYALQAKRFVETALKSNKEIFIQYGEQAKDRYGRVLAHVALRNKQNLNALILKQGLASTIVVPPNVQLADCYFKHEQLARAQGLNRWSHPDSLYIAADTLKETMTGFRFVYGTVRRVGRSRGSIFLQLANKFTLRIKRKDFKYFPNLDLEHMSLDNFTNKTVYTRGWVYQWNKSLYLQLRHDKMMQIQ